MENHDLELRRPSTVAAVLWGFGLFILGLTVYSIFTWEGGILNADLQGSLLMFVSLASGANAIVTGALIVMLTLRYKKRQ